MKDCDEVKIASLLLESTKKRLFFQIIYRNDDIIPFGPPGQWLSFIDGSILPKSVEMLTPSVFGYFGFPAPDCNQTRACKQKSHGLSRLFTDQGLGEDSLAE